MQTVSERIFELMKGLNINQKQLAEMTGIAESTISDWKKKGTNPTSDKILLICDALHVTPEYLLSGEDSADGRRREKTGYVVDRDSDLGLLIETYQSLPANRQQRLLAYLESLKNS